MEDWARLDKLAESWRGRKLPSELRVQVEYCHALALDALQKEDPSRQQEALNAYSRVLSADATGSMDLVLKAATNLLRIYAEDPGVQYSIKNWKGVNEKVNSTGYQRLMEANSLVKYYRLAGFQDLQPLSPEHEKFCNTARNKLLLHHRNQLSQMWVPLKIQTMRTARRHLILRPRTVSNTSCNTTQ